jgi:hypothetical protein
VLRSWSCTASGIGSTQGDRRGTVAPLGGLSSAGVIDQDASHGAGGDAEEVGLALPPWIPPVNQA